MQEEPRHVMNRSSSGTRTVGWKLKDTRVGEEKREVTGKLCKKIIAPRSQGQGRKKRRGEEKIKVGIEL